MQLAPDSPAEPAATNFVGPVPVPKHLREPRSAKQRLAAIGGTIAAVAAVALALFMMLTPEPSPAPGRGAPGPSGRAKANEGGSQRPTDRLNQYA